MFWLKISIRFLFRKWKALAWLLKISKAARFLIIIRRRICVSCKEKLFSQVFCEHTGKTRPLTMSDFEKVVNQEMQTNNSYKDRAEVEMANSSRSPSSCGSVTSTMQLGRPKNIALMRSSVKDAQLSIFPPNNPQLSISDNCCRYDNNGLIKHNNEGIC